MTHGSAGRRPGPVTAVVVLLVLGLIANGFIALGGLSGLAVTASLPTELVDAAGSDALTGLRTLAIGTTVIALVDLVVLALVLRPLQLASPIARTVLTARPVVLAAAQAVLLAVSDSPATALVGAVAVLLFGALIPGLLWLPDSSRRYFTPPPVRQAPFGDAPTVAFRLPSRRLGVWAPIAAVVVALVVITGTVVLLQSDEPAPGTTPGAGTTAAPALGAAFLPTEAGRMGSIPIGSDGVQAVALGPGGDTLVVGTYPPVPGNGSASAGVVAVVAAASGRVEATIPVGKGLLDLALTPDGNRAYATMSIDDVVEVIDLPSRRVVARIPTGSFPQGIAMSPDGRTAWVVQYGEGTVVAIDTEANAARASVRVGEDPTEVTVSPDGQTVTVGRQGGLTVVDTTSLAVRQVELGASTQVSALETSTDGTRTYVAVYGGNRRAVLDVPDDGNGSGIVRLPIRPQALAATRGLMIVGNQEPGTSAPPTLQAIDLRTFTPVRAAFPLRSGAPSSIAISPDGVNAYIAHDGTAVTVLRLRDR